MGKPPCCEKIGAKKGRWMPEEDIILASYIQEHGPSNWLSVSVNTGLMRNGQSFRRRWTNFLRPGIRRGNFTPQEESFITELQSLLGNRWAAIATYFPQRTDGDIKNYWYTHLTKKLNKQQEICASSSVPAAPSEHSIVASHRTSITSPLSKDSYAQLACSSPADEVTQPIIGQCSPIDTTNGCYSSSSSYAFSVDNISKLLNDFTNISPTQGDATNTRPSSVIDSNRLFSFDHMSSRALPPISDNIPPLMPLLPQQQLPWIEEWLFDDAADRAGRPVDARGDLRPGVAQFPCCFSSRNQANMMADIHLA